MRYGFGLGESGLTEGIVWSLACAEVWGGVKMSCTDQMSKLPFKRFRNV